MPTIITPKRITIELSYPLGGIQDWQAVTQALVRTLQYALRDEECPLNAHDSDLVGMLICDLIDFRLDHEEVALTETIAPNFFLPIVPTSERKGSRL